MSTLMLLPAALSVLLLVGGAALVFSAARWQRTIVSKRVQLIAAAEGPAEAAAQAPALTPGAALMRAPTGKMSQAELREITRACRRFNIPIRYAATVYASLRIAPAIVLGVAGFLVARLLLSHNPAVVWMVAAAASAVVGWIAPGMVLENFTKKHVSQAAQGLPEALELMVVCVEAGLSLEDAIDRVSVEIRWSQPALAEELTLTSADMKILPDRDQALANLAARVDTPSVRSVVTSLSQTLRYGTPLAQALRVTSSELRNDALVRMEERANRLPTLLTLPMMLCIMPTIFLIIGGPAVLKLMDLFAL